jgi:uncharacterized protein
MSAGVSRRMKFDLPKDLPTVFIEGRPEESYVNIAVSLTLPYVEPYLIRTMRAARPLVKDPALAKDLDTFCAQEGQHYKQHLVFNALFKGRGFDGLEKFEAELEADYQRFTQTRSLRFNLAYAEGFEAFTTSMSHVAARQDTAPWNPVARDLFYWHLVEELEHRTVAFEVYGHVTPGYFYRVVVGSYAQWHLARFLFKVRDYLMQVDQASFAAHGGAKGRRRRMRELFSRFLFQILPLTFKSWLPWYHPGRVAVPASMQLLAERYTKEAVGVSGPPPP